MDHGFLLYLKLLSNRDKVKKTVKGVRRMANDHGTFKYKRNQRLIAMTQVLMQAPNQLINFARFTQEFGCAKASVSEDIEMIKEVMLARQTGVVETFTGKSGGVIFRPALSEKAVQDLQTLIQDKMLEGKRILPGNYIYVNDLLQDPYILKSIAQLIAFKYYSKKIDAVVTIEAKGIGLAAMVASFLNVPYVVARRESSKIEGSTISINYISGSHQVVQKMELSKQSLQAHSKVLMVDDFLRNGGTMAGLLSLMEEFNSKAVGICVFAENKAQGRVALPNYQALFETSLAYNNEVGHYQLETQLGNFFQSAKADG